MTSGFRWLLPWPQMVQVNPAKFSPPAAELQSDNASVCSSAGLHTLWHVLLRLWWRILFVCHHSGTYCHLLLQGPCSPPLLLPLSLSVALRTPCVLFLFFVLGIFFSPLPASVFFCSSPPLFSSSSFSPRTWPPVWLSSIPKRVFAAFYCAEGRLSPSRCHSLSAVTPLPVFSSPFFRPSTLGHVCLSASALMDLSVGGLQHVSALASVTRDDLHLIRGWRWVCETCWGM